jgi:hypothetical protein
MGVLRQLFGPSRAEIWKQLSEQIHADFVAGGLLSNDRIVAAVDSWTVTLDTVTEAVGRASVSCTRIRAPYKNHDNFRFLVYNRGAIDDIGLRRGMQDVIVGDAAFDSKFIVQGSDEAKVREYFQDAALRGMMMALPPFRFEVKDDEGWFGEAFPEGVDELYLQSAGEIRELEQLKAIYALFAEALHQLCRIGSAHENEPVQTR